MEDDKLAHIKEWLHDRKLSKLLAFPAREAIGGPAEDLSSELTGKIEFRLGQWMVGLPGEKFQTCDASSNAIFWLPRLLPETDASSVLVASSRIGNQPDSIPHFFDALRTLTCRMDCERHFLITHKSIATHSYIERAAHLFNVPMVKFCEFPEKLDEGWFEYEGSKINRDDCYTIYFDASQLDFDEGEFQIDQFLFRIAQEVRILSVRKSGNVYSAAKQRLEKHKRCRTFVLMDTGQPKRVFDELVNDGAIPWLLFDENGCAAAKESSPRPIKAEVCSLTEFQDSEILDDFFLHWTRRRKGPWPNQSENQFLDDLIMGNKSANHDRVAALSRILATRKLLANNVVTRDDTPVVCFSKLTVDNLPALRTFRSHLSRWDFETVGVAIRRSVLVAFGIREVMYGDEDLWNEMPPKDRPFFQKQTSKSVDWTVEQEWRVIGDIDLTKIAINDAFVFVSSTEEAREVSLFSIWPVVVLCNGRDIDERESANPSIMNEK